MNSANCFPSMKLRNFQYIACNSLSNADYLVSAECSLREKKHIGVQTPEMCWCKGPATRNDFVNDIVDDARADAIFATLKTTVDDGTSTISSTISLRVAGH